MAFVRGTVNTLGVSLIVAMPMKCAFVTEFFPASLTSGRNMIDFNHLSIFEMEFTPTTFPFLLFQELALDAAQEVVAAKPLTPIPQISIVWTGCPFYFDMPLDLGLRVIPQGRLLVSERPTVAFIHMPVFVCYPSFAFVGMPKSCPSLELQKEDLFTVVEDFCCGHCPMIPRPSSNFRIQFTNELTLRPVPMDVDHFPKFCQMSFHCFFAGSDECFEAKRRPIMARFSGVGFSGGKLPHRPA